MTRRVPENPTKIAAQSLKVMESCKNMKLRIKEIMEYRFIMMLEIEIGMNFMEI